MCKDYSQFSNPLGDFNRQKDRFETIIESPDIRYILYKRFSKYRMTILDMFKKNMVSLYREMVEYSFKTE